MHIDMQKPQNKLRDVIVESNLVCGVIRERYLHRKYEDLHTRGKGNAEGAAKILTEFQVS